MGRLHVQKDTRRASIFRSREVISASLPGRAPKYPWLKCNGELSSPTFLVTVQADRRKSFDFKWTWHEVREREMMIILYNSETPAEREFFHFRLMSFKDIGCGNWVWEFWQTPPNSFEELWAVRVLRTETGKFLLLQHSCHLDRTDVDLCKQFQFYVGLSLRSSTVSLKEIIVLHFVALGGTEAGSVLQAGQSKRSSLCSHSAETFCLQLSVC